MHTQIYTNIQTHTDEKKIYIYTHSHTPTCIYYYKLT